MSPALRLAACRRRCMHAAALAVLAVCAMLRAAAAQDTLGVSVLDEALNPVDHRLFGQFLERPSWGGSRQETGPERAYAPATRGIDPAVVALVRELRIPVVRWPGGTDVDYMDWTDMTDGAPGRAGAERPASVGHTGETVTNRVSMDAGLDAIEAAGAETILVVNLLDGLNGTRTPRAAALHAAGLVAYAAAPLGAPLPAGMPDYPAIRARNGRAQPWAIRYVQLGNEWHGWKDASGAPFLPNAGAVDPARKEALFEALRLTIAAVRAVAPGVEIIVDGMIDDATDEMRQRLGDDIQYLAVHQYHPWGLDAVARDADGDGRAETPLDLEAFVRDSANARAAWTAWTAPRRVDADGLGVLPDDKLALIRAEGYPAAMTEWNWNGGWWTTSGAVVGNDLARGIGAASYLFEMMRRGGDVALATQSMLVGRYWEIAGIALADSAGPYRRPSLMATAFLSAHVGTERLGVRHGALPTVAQPYQMGPYLMPLAAVALVEPLATRDADSVYVHLLNRSFDAAQTVRLDLAALGPVGGGARHTLRGDPRGGPGQGRDPRETAWATTEALALDGDAVTVVLPPASVTTVAVARRGG